MDNTTILYNAIQRTYRSALVDLVRQRMTQHYGERAEEELKSQFRTKDPNTGETYWDNILKAAQERRSGGTGELSTPIRDAFELCGVEHFFNIFEKHFDILIPTHAAKPMNERRQARQALTMWMKQIKNIRDPISHPVTEDVSFDDAANVLYNARKVLDMCGCPEASAQILRLNATLQGGFTGDQELVLTLLPPASEVVMDFVGRHHELQVLRDWVYSGNSRRWALSGDGGKGKSAIAFAFAKSLSTQSDHGLDAIIWLSAKRRRFVEGTTTLVDRPDFQDKATALAAIHRFFGGLPESCDNVEANVLALLCENTSLLVIDDIDTIQGDGEDAVEFLLMKVPEITKCRILFTSRRQLTGLANVTTQVLGLTGTDADDFIKSRCDLMGIPAGPILAAKGSLLEVTDSSPLFIEDLLRLSQAGLPIEKAIGLWAEKRGDEARKYALQREYDQLSDYAKQVLLALSVQGPCRADDICKGLDWPLDRLVDAMTELRKMFLMPQQSGADVLALNRNTQALVLQVFSGTEAHRRTQRLMKAAAGELRPKRQEDQFIAGQLSRARLAVRQGRGNEAEEELQGLVAKYPGRADVLSNLAWVQKVRGDVASARMNYRRSHELGCRDRDMYWHWSELEASEREWKASEEAATMGIAKFGDEQGLLFRLGYALHRQGKELILEGDAEQGRRRCDRAQTYLEKAKQLRTAEERNFAIRNQIFRAIALNLESLEDGVGLARLFAEWFRDVPTDSVRDSEYERIRRKFPQYLSAR